MKLVKYIGLVSGWRIGGIALAATMLAVLACAAALAPAIERAGSPAPWLLAIALLTFTLAPPGFLAVYFGKRRTARTARLFGVSLSVFGVLVAAVAVFASGAPAKDVLARALWLPTRLAAAGAASSVASAAPSAAPSARPSVTSVANAASARPSVTSVANAATAPLPGGDASSLHLNVRAVLGAQSPIPAIEVDDTLRYAVAYAVFGGLRIEVASVPLTCPAGRDHGAGRPPPPRDDPSFAPSAFAFTLPPGRDAKFFAGTKTSLASFVITNTTGQEEFSGALTAIEVEPFRPVPGEHVRGRAHLATAKRGPRDAEKTTKVDGAFDAPICPGSYFDRYARGWPAPPLPAGSDGSVSGKFGQRTFRAVGAHAMFRRDVENNTDVLVSLVLGEGPADGLGRDLVDSLRYKRVELDRFGARPDALASVVPAAGRASVPSEIRTEVSDGELIAWVAIDPSSTLVDGGIMRGTLQAWTPVNDEAQLEKSINVGGKFEARVHFASGR